MSRTVAEIRVRNSARKDKKKKRPSSAVDGAEEAIKSGSHSITYCPGNMFEPSAVITQHSTYAQVGHNN